MHKLLHFVERCVKINVVNKLFEIMYMPEVKSMEILRVKIKGFRNITDAEILFDDITAFVGLNGYGKSNIMDAIDFGIDFIKHSPASKNKLMILKKNIPVLKSNAGQNYEFEIELKAKHNRKNFFILYGFEFSWGVNNSSAKIIKEYLKIRLDGKDQKYSTIINRDENTAKYKRSETGRCNIKIKIDDDALVVNKILAFDQLYCLDIIEKINNIQFYIERHLDASPSYLPDPFILKGFGELELGGIESVPRAIFFLKEQYPDKYALLIDAFMQLFPRIKDIDVLELSLDSSDDLSIKMTDDAPYVYTDSIYTMIVTDEKLIQPIRFERLSDGAKRVFLMLTYAVIADTKGLSMIVIEEPENSIHPALLQNYLDILSQLVNKCKIVFTSHSPYIIQYIDPRNIYIGMNSDDGSVNFKRIASTKVKALMNDAEIYDKSVGDYIFNILSTDYADETLREYIEDYE